MLRGGRWQAALALRAGSVRELSQANAELAGRLSLSLSRSRSGGSPEKQGAGGEAEVEASTSGPASVGARPASELEGRAAALARRLAEAEEEAARCRDWAADERARGDAAEMRAAAEAERHVAELEELTAEVGALRAEVDPPPPCPAFPPTTPPTVVPMDQTPLRAEVEARAEPPPPPGSTGELEGGLDGPASEAEALRRANELLRRENDALRAGPSFEAAPSEVAAPQGRGRRVLRPKAEAAVSWVAAAATSGGSRVLRGLAAPRARRAALSSRGGARQDARWGEMELLRGESAALRARLASERDRSDACVAGHPPAPAASTAAAAASIADAAHPRCPLSSSKRISASARAAQRCAARGAGSSGSWQTRARAVRRCRPPPLPPSY